MESSSSISNVDYINALSDLLKLEHIFYPKDSVQRTVTTSTNSAMHTITNTVNVSFAEEHH